MKRPVASAEIAEIGSIRWYGRAARRYMSDKGQKRQKLATDAREKGDGKSLALAKVVAGLLGVSSGGDIFRRAQRDRRRRQHRLIPGLFTEEHVRVGPGGLSADI